MERSYGDVGVDFEIRYILFGFVVCEKIVDHAASGLVVLECPMCAVV